MDQDSDDKVPETTGRDSTTLDRTTWKGWVHLVLNLGDGELMEVVGKTPTSCGNRKTRLATPLVKVHRAGYFLIPKSRVAEVQARIEAARQSPEEQTHQRIRELQEFVLRDLGAVLPEDIGRIPESERDNWTPLPGKLIYADLPDVFTFIPWMERFGMETDLAEEYVEIEHSCIVATAHLKNEDTWDRIAGPLYGHVLQVVKPSLSILRP